MANFSPEALSQHTRFLAVEAALSGDNLAPTVVRTLFKKVHSAFMTLKRSTAPADGTKVLSFEVPNFDGEDDRLAFVKTDNTLTSVSAAKSYSRFFSLRVVVDETFADGDTTQTAFTFGKGATADAISDGTDLVDAVAGTEFQYAGVLAAGDDFNVTPTAAAGTGTGGITVFFEAVPAHSVLPGDVSILGFTTADGADPTLVASTGQETVGVVLFGS